ncbi:MAG: hypothetical protein WC707_05990 [Candidatus Babeliaceae bacterium]|jgi:hypothetical protein
MNYLRLATLTIFSLSTWTTCGTPKDKTFQHVTVLTGLRAQDLLVLGNASIVGDLFVHGKIIASSIVGGGTVTGPSPSTLNAVPRFGDTSGTLLENSSVLIDNFGNVTLNGITKNGNTVAWPSIVGAVNTFLASDGAGNLVYATPAGGGNVSTALNFTTDNARVRTDLLSGVDDIKQSNVTLDNSNNIAGINSLTATTVNANVVGSSSLNVLKSGDTMTGNLTMATQNAIRLQDGAAVNYVGLNGPASVASSYTLSFPSATPIGHQLLRTNSITPTNLEWVTQGSSVLPVNSRSIYVAKFGNDVTGDGSYATPYASLDKAVDVANGLATSSDPVAILISSGVYIENNSAGPIAITANGISVIGASPSGVIIQPNTLSNDLISAIEGVQFSTLTFESGGVSTAAAVDLAGTNNTSNFTSVTFLNFNTGVLCAGTNNINTFDLCIFIGNGTALNINNVQVACSSCKIEGSPTTTPANTGVMATGASAQVLFADGLCVQCTTGFNINNSANFAGKATAFSTNTDAIVVATGAQLNIQACSFAPVNSAGTITSIQASGVGTLAIAAGCIFNYVGPAINSTAIKVTNQAVFRVIGSEINGYQNALVIGDPGDTLSTQLSASSLSIVDCTNDIIQQGSSTLVFTSGTATSSKISIANSTNVDLAFFDLDDNNSLNIGSLSNVRTQLIQAAIGTTNNPEFVYFPSIYSTQSIGFENPSANASTLSAIANNDVHVTAITTDRTKVAGIRLVSDTASPVGGTTALRGWDINKIGTTAELAFDYQNSDIFALGVTPLYTILQLDGENNQVQLPNVNTKIVLDADTNLYRGAANTLKTDGNLIVGGLTANRAVATNGSSQLVSSSTTAAELDFLVGTTSDIQTQLNGKVAKAGDTMTGTLQLPAGTTAAPALVFTGSTTTGLSASLGNLSLSTSGLERMKISSGGTVSINNLTPAGVVHNDVSGDLSSSLIVNADVSNSAAIVDGKLATISSSGKVANSATTATSGLGANTIVERDGSNNFSAGTITATLVGAASLNVLKSGDTMTGALTLPAGTAASPALKFSGSINTGLSSPTVDALSFDVNGTEALNIASSGNITVNNFTGTAGVVHNSALGVLTSSLIVNSDITPGTISNASLATISSTDTPGNIVVRDLAGNFATNMITLDGTVSNPTDAATKAYVDLVAGLGFVVKTPALVVSTTDTPITGLYTIDSVPLAANNRVLLVGQSTTTQNGLWLAQAGAWTRPADFATGTLAGRAYVLITSGTNNGGSSWLCSTPLAVIDTDPIAFTQFSLATQTTGANVGTGAGQIFRDKTGNTLNFKTLAAGPHMVITNNTDDVTLATDATGANVAGTIVARDGSGNFSAGTITAALVGAASLNVLKAGDTMTGNLTMANANAVRLQDLAGVNYVGLNGPASVTSSYTLSLPAATPTARQVLQANAITPTQLEWFTLGGSVVPATSRTIYVTKAGNDVTGNGTFSSPYASLAKAVSVANTLASTANPVAILMSSGVYTEDNSAGPIAITAGGIAIVGDASDTVIIQPNTLSNDLISTTVGVQFLNLTFQSGGVSTARAISLAGTGALTNFTSVIIFNFNTGVSCAGTSNTNIFDLCLFVGNGTALDVNNVELICSSCKIEGSPTTTPANTGVSVTGSGAQVLFSDGLCTQCTTGFTVSNNALLAMRSTFLSINTNAVIAATGAQLTLEACSFAPINTAATLINIQASGAGTSAVIAGCIFNYSGPAINSTAVTITNQAVVTLTGSEINGYRNGLIIGNPGDTSSTQVSASSLFIANCVNDIIQQGTSSLIFTSSSASSTKIAINNSANVTLAFFDLDSQNVLNIGPLSDTNINLLEAAISTANVPSFNYKSSLYATRGMGYTNPAQNPSTLFVQSNSGADVTAITTDRTKVAGVRLVSDTASPVGTTGALRGWDINKNATSAELSFSYQNSDVFGQIAIPEYTVMQLDGVNNKVQLPTANTQIVFAADTNVYRSAAGILKTDGNLIVGGLTANRAVATDGSSQLVSSTTTAAELNFLAGVTSGVQAQLDSKLSTAGGSMTGTLQLPAGTTAAPALIFTGSTTTGLSANSSALSLSTSGLERMKISSAGTVSINDLTPAGVVHNDVSGNLTSSLIINADVSNSAAIDDIKLATIFTAGKVANSATTATSANTANAIVARDASGNFAAGTITASFSGAAALNVLKAGDTMTGALTLPAGTAASPTLKFSGSTNTGLSAPVPNTLSFDVNSTEAININSSGNITVDNFTGTAGVVHSSALGVLSSSLIVNSDITPGTISNASLASISSSNTPNTIVLRNASGDFSAGTITGALLGNVTGAASLNVLKAGDTMTGTLILPAGSAASPALKFTGSTNTGLSAAIANTLSLDANGIEGMNISPTAITTILKLILTNLLCNQALQSVVPTVGGSVTTASGTSILILKNAANVGGAGFTVTFPPSPTDGQFFTILQGSTNSTALNNAAGTGGAAIVNPITTLNPGANFSSTANGASVTYYYNTTANSWYRYGRG